MVSAYPDHYWVEWRNKNWSGSYTYHEMRNERKVYKVDFMLANRFNIFVFREMRKKNLWNISIFGTTMGKADGN